MGFSAAGFLRWAEQEGDWKLSLQAELFVPLSSHTSLPLLI